MNLPRTGKTRKLQTAKSCGRKWRKAIALKAPWLTGQHPHSNLQAQLQSPPNPSKLCLAETEQHIQTSTWNLEGPLLSHNLEKVVGLHFLIQSSKALVNDQRECSTRRGMCTSGTEHSQDWTLTSTVKCPLTASLVPPRGKRALRTGCWGRCSLQIEPGPSLAPHMRIASKWTQHPN